LTRMKTIVCLQCQNERPHKAHGLCERCYSRLRRLEKSREEFLDALPKRMATLWRRLIK